MDKKFTNIDKPISEMSDQEILSILHKTAKGEVNSTYWSSWNSNNFRTALRTIKQRLIDHGCAAHPDFVPIAEIMALHGNRSSDVYAQHFLDHFYRLDNEWANLLQPKPENKQTQKPLSQRGQGLKPAAPARLK
jgi:hypothetical protein